MAEASGLKMLKKKNCLYYKVWNQHDIVIDLLAEQLYEVNFSPIFLSAKGRYKEHDALLQTSVRVFQVT